MERTTLRLQEDLLRKAKYEARRRGKTLTALVEEGLRNVLAEEERLRRKPVKLPVSKKGGGTFAGIDLDNSAELLDVMEGLR